MLLSKRNSLAFYICFNMLECFISQSSLASLSCWVSQPLFWSNCDIITLCSRYTHRFHNLPNTSSISMSEIKDFSFSIYNYLARLFCKTGASEFHYCLVVTVPNGYSKKKKRTVTCFGLFQIINSKNTQNQYYSTAH